MLQTRSLLTDGRTSLDDVDDLRIAFIVLSSDVLLNFGNRWKSLGARSNE